MSRSRAAFPADWSVGDLLKHLGDIPPERVRLYPSPGRATERHVIALEANEDRLYELIDRVLVQKTTGIAETFVAMEIGCQIGNFAHGRDLGVVTETSGPFRLAPGQVRRPGAAFVSRERLPDMVLPDVAILELAPDFAVEALSEGNTEKEMERKLKDYFFAGVRLVWYIDIKKRTAEVFTAPNQGVTLTEDQALNGGEVLPGFRLPLRQLFAQLAPPAGRKRNGRKKPS